MGQRAEDRPGIMVVVSSICLTDRGPLSRPHLPATVTLDENVGEPYPLVDRLALRIAATDVVDSRDDRGVSLDPNAQIGKVEGLEHVLVSAHIRQRLRLARDRAGATADLGYVGSVVPLEP